MNSLHFTAIFSNFPEETGEIDGLPTFACIVLRGCENTAVHLREMGGHEDFLSCFDQPEHPGTWTWTGSAFTVEHVAGDYDVEYIGRWSQVFPFAEEIVVKPKKPERIENSEKELKLFTFRYHANEHSDYVRTKNMRSTSMSAAIELFESSSEFKHCRLISTSVAKEDEA